ncbi:heavy-metal-associated domain-containing protein [Magnetococcus sp. PR-3]|uniref:heavy-metal-associated domain-containing protein n=1 Tax=Magnetococcus sp. PR-3 TaxID=3120355 RepID=UPI002FCE5DAC
MAQVTLSVSGMSCQHCVKAVTEVAMEIDGITACDIDLEKATVTLTLSDGVDVDALQATASRVITEEGYTVQG